MAPAIRESIVLGNVQQWARSIVKKTVFSFSSSDKRVQLDEWQLWNMWFDAMSGYGFLDDFSTR